MAKKAVKKKRVETLTHEEATRKNIPTAEYQSVMHKKEQTPIRVAYERRNRDLDPQLVWRGKDDQDWSDLVVQAAPLYIQEKVHPKVLIDDLLKRTKYDEKFVDPQFDLFSDFNGLPSEGAKTEFYQHDANWSNRMILGDSLQVMASLAEREGLRGQVQCIYIDPPYGIKFNSNFQWSTTSKDIKDVPEHITREPEQVKAFRDTWRDGIHSYLTYLRDRFTVARDLLSQTGSIFVQIGDENVHFLKGLLEEVFGSQNFCSLITFRKKTMPLGSDYFEGVCDYVLWFAKDKSCVKTRPLMKEKSVEGNNLWSNAQCSDLTDIRLTSAQLNNHKLLPNGSRVYRLVSLLPAQYRQNQDFVFEFNGRKFDPPKKSCWKTTAVGMLRMAKAGRIKQTNKSLQQVLFHDDYPVTRLTALWGDTGGTSNKIYVVQTTEIAVQRCILASTDPGDLVIDPTCGSGTTSFVAEQWGRRWISIDTSRVALALARARIMGARYPYYLLADSRGGKLKEAKLSCTIPSEAPTYGNLKQGFVCERVPHITLKAVANNSEIDVIWEKFHGKLELLREQLNKELKKKWEEWELPRDANDNWSNKAKSLHQQWWNERIARQKEFHTSIATKSDFEYLYDKPYKDNSKVRVAGPFTVESLSPHRVLTVGADDDLIDPVANKKDSIGKEQDFVQMILENLKTAGVQQAHKDDKIIFISLVPWPGDLVCAEGQYYEGGTEKGKKKRAAIFVGPEFGTVSRPDLVEAAKEAGDADFEVLISCAFNYDAHSSEFDKLGRIPVLKAHMNADLHMADDLKNTGKGNLFVIFGEPDIDIIQAENNQVQVKVNGVDVFDPSSGEVRSDGADGIACWFIDTDYNEESFFVRHAYFLGANDPYKSLKTTLKSEINKDAWETLHSDTSRSFDKPQSGRIAVKVINHLGDEVMKVFKVE
jgi:adenine-specific DNA-methyltransferase